MKYCVFLSIHDVITCATFGEDRLRGLGVGMDQISGSLLTYIVDPYNTVTIPCMCER